MATRNMAQEEYERQILAQQLNQATGEKTAGLADRLARVRAGGYSVSEADLDRMDRINQGLELGKKEFSGDPNLQRLRRIREQMAQGYSTPELSARKELTLNEADANRAKAVQNLRSNIARSGVGGARGAAMESEADRKLIQDQSDVNRKMLLDESEVQRKGVDALAEDIYKIKLGEAGYGIGTAQLGSADKAAEAARAANNGGGKK